MPYPQPPKTVHSAPENAAPDMASQLNQAPPRDLRLMLARRGAKPQRLRPIMEISAGSMAWLAPGDGTVVIGHGPFSSSEACPPGTTAFYLRDFASAGPSPWKIPSRVERIPHLEFSSRFPDRPLACEWRPLDAGPFSSVFQEIMTAIRSGLFEKTVPVVVERGLCEFDATEAIAAAVTRQTLPLRTYGWIQGSSGFAGATPELLFSLKNGNHLETMALAGTAKREDREVFAVDEKEIREHEYVAQTLVSKLQNLGTPIRQNRQILDLGSIVHFLTLIGIELDRPECPDRLIDLLHPTPALGPLPRTKENLHLLHQWRQQLGCPGEFGAPFGLWHEGTFDAVVAIRGLWWNGRQVSLPTGCGIIEASRLVNEWRELRLKRDSVKKFCS